MAPGVIRIFWGRWVVYCFITLTQTATTAWGKLALASYTSLPSLDLCLPSSLPALPLDFLSVVSPFRYAYPLSFQPFFLVFDCLVKHIFMLAVWQAPARVPDILFLSATSVLPTSAYLTPACSAESFPLLCSFLSSSFPPSLFHLETPPLICLPLFSASSPSSPPI